MMATLLASFLSLFVLISAVDAAACITEEAGACLATATTISATAAASPSGDDGADRDAADVRGCAHCQCHHGAVAGPPGAPDMARAPTTGLPSPTPFVERRPSRSPTGPERPPRV
jgi:hypothetical protein